MFMIQLQATAGVHNLCSDNAVLPNGLGMFQELASAVRIAAMVAL